MLKVRKERSLFYFTLRFEIEENSLDSINKMEVDSQRLSNNDLIHLGEITSLINKP